LGNFAFRGFNAIAQQTVLIRALPANVSFVFFIKAWRAVLSAFAFMQNQICIVITAFAAVAAFAV